ncbi:hypothetical protein CLOBOL_06843 [Enterocloster bolteae ATCC BAA-613]|uniref:Uncharacterized protein n=1 Tax=Enterocloster bolteae (strain ATCC BAA-613 / DSM 15670 / CCUG 46953 / JCM 12243 / WAL 16351) TaxID=411902 RepID=A8S478_ENTBW|nr:hypothetical protein CLOBOL_06843 [Enterocloster bolteae ATCC BAA-613]
MPEAEIRRRTKDTQKMGKESTGRMISPFFYQNRYQRFLLIRLNMI